MKYPNSVRVGKEEEIEYRPDRKDERKEDKRKTT